MLFYQLICIAIVLPKAMLLQYPVNPSSDISTDEKNIPKANRTEQSDESGHELEIDVDDVKEKKYLDDAMKTVLDPNTIIVTHNNDDEAEHFQVQLEELDKENMTLEVFMEEMDKLSLDVCKTSQDSLWSYVTDINSEKKKNKMIRIAAEEDTIKKKYWNIIKDKYLSDERLINDLHLQRKLRIIKERGINIQVPQSEQREEIDTMQRVWSRVAICSYGSASCDADDSLKTMSDVISIFKQSNDTHELSYYWEAYRDATGKKIRPIFKQYVDRMNTVAISENFTDAGDMWRFNFEDDNFVQTVERLWSEIKPLYTLLHDYVRSKLASYYKDVLQNDDNLIPAHILGNIWAQSWQAIYSKVVAYPGVYPPTENKSMLAKDLFDTVDEFHQSLGFDSARDSYEDINDTMSTVNCLPSSHDMCDGVNYKIKWCGEKISDLKVGLSRAARLLGHVQYFKHYQNLQPLYRDGPNPAFHDAVSDIVAVQLISPDHIQKFTPASTGREATVNHLLWLALEKFPLMAYAYVLDKWRWDVFANSSMENWNQHWWDLRTQETGISPPVARNESDLDPAAKYHVVSHVQYITYFISHILEFQILLSLCKTANHTGPLHECSIYGVKEAGNLLSKGMELGASEDWRTVLQTMTGETDLSTEGILQYFSPLQEFLQESAKAKSNEEDMDKNAPIIIGIIVVVLTLLMFILYCVKKRDAVSKIFGICGLSKNGSLDIATNDISHSKTKELEGIREEKV